jgi:hypothetical protein
VSIASELIPDKSTFEDRSPGIELAGQLCAADDMHRPSSGLQFVGDVPNRDLARADDDRVGRDQLPATLDFNM